MHFLTISALVAVSLPLAASKSLFVDSSCTNKPDWNTYFTETQNFAKLAGQRMSSGSDTDFKNVFNRIMKTDAGSTDGQFVKGILDEIASLSSTDDLKGADIRLYCDDDKRWATVKKGFYDKDNEMVTENEPSCRRTNDQGAKTGLGRCYERKAKGRPGHNDNRIIVTICDLTFTSPAADGVPASLKDSLVTDQQAVLADTLVEGFSGMVSSTLLHELAHAVSYNGQFVVQDLPDKDTAYGWDNIFGNAAATAVRNADNYAFLGIWAGLADLGYTLPRINTEDPAIKAGLEGFVKEGRLRTYSDITKRSLKMIARWFTA